MNGKIVTDSEGRKYQVFEGISFHTDTNQSVIKVLLGALKSRRSRKPQRLRVYYGDTKTGRDWEEIYDVSGYIGNSTGTIKIPLLVHNSRSLGGGGLLDNAIVKIRSANKRNGGVIYQHPKYHKAGG